jgi:DNA-binding CsgD family transcriptional regulator
VQQLLVELHSLRHDIEELRLSRLLTLLGRVRDALARLRSPETTRQMLELVSAEVCRSCGFSRAVLFRVDGSVLHVRDMHWTEDEEWQEEWTSIAQQHPPVLDPRDRETQLLRHHVPVMVQPEAAHGMKEVADAAQTIGYVAAPLVLNGAVIGTLHGDRYFTGEPVDTIARDVLATFAEGFGGILERTALLERVRLQSRRLREVLAEAETTIDELTYTGAEMRLDDRGEIESLAPSPEAVARSDSRLLSLLTPRELEVIELMASGATNTEIAGRLVISQTTVKSHVKQILRKMRATNRAQAASRYVRLQQMSEN